MMPKAPVVSVWTECLDSSVDVGAAARYVVHVNNTGDGQASAAWLNGTLDRRLVFANGSDGAAADGREIRWSLDGIGPHSSRAFRCNATLDSGAAHGTVLDSLFAIDYADTAGAVMGVSSDEPYLVAALSSDVGFSFVSSAAAVHPGDNIVATVYFNNTGYGMATSVSIAMQISDALELNESTHAYESSGGSAWWNFTEVGPGPHSFAVTFTALDTGLGNASASLHAEMRVVDQVRGDMGVVAQGDLGVSVLRVYTIWEKIYWPWSGIAGAAAAAALAVWLWWAYKPTPPSISDVFFIYRDGRLISHRSAGSAMRQELDTDLVSSMLTAVQQFVSDSLSEGGAADGVKKLEFGEKEIYIERGTSTYLAVIYTGDMNRKLNSRMRELVEKIEAAHPELADWNGNTAGLESVGGLLGELAMEWQARGGGTKSLDEADKV
jgi:hypothetical protein